MKKISFLLPAVLLAGCEALLSTGTTNLVVITLESVELVENNSVGNERG